LPGEEDRADSGVRSWLRIVGTLEKLVHVYDAANLIMSMGSLRYVRKIFGREVERIFRGKEGIILDAGCGPGSSISTILKNAGKGVYVVGLDPLEPMLIHAKSRFSEEPRVELVRGVFEALPFRRNSLLGATFSFSYRDAIDYGKAAHEAYESVKAGGSIAILDLGKPVRRRLYSKILEGPFMLLLPPLAGAIVMGWEGVKRYMELRRTYLRFPSTPSLFILFSKLFGKARCFYMLGGATFILEAVKRRA